MKAKHVYLTALSLALVGLLALAVPRLIERAQLGEEVDQARALIGSDWPQLVAARPTTSGEIYLANLDGQVEALRLRLARGADDRLLARLALLRYHRFQITGDIREAEAARQILSEAWNDDAGPELATAYARVLIGFHEFDQADAVLSSVEAAGGAEDPVAELRDSLARIRGKAWTDEPGQPLPAENTLAPATRAGQAADLAANGQPAAAASLLKAVQDSYNDTSPYTLAWIHVQQGIIFLGLEDYGSARVFFSAAYQRFPQYTLAAEHLAETELALGHFEAAAALYRTVAERSGHPEFYHQLSKAERALGNEAAAKRFESLALEGYEALVEKYPRMYADHAARYYIDIGAREPALALANLNLAQRNDPMARALLVTARECCR